MLIEVEQDPENEDNVILPIPQEIIDKFDLQEGDDVHINHLENQTIEITFFRNGVQLKA